jgi:hypothetical protein
MISNRKLTLLNPDVAPADLDRLVGRIAQAGADLQAAQRPT